MTSTVRGLVEGFYGRLWTWEERTRVAQVIGAAGFTTYAYAPKEDPLQNGDWRAPYPADVAAELSRFGHACRAAGMRLWIGLRPVAIGYADDADMARVADKLLAYLDLGADRLVLLADDIPSQLDDRARGRFATLAEAHAWLIERVIARTGLPPATFVFVPTDYHGAGSPYLEHLGRELPPDVDVCWTGPGVFSPRISVEDAETIAQVLRRSPLVWDNYPVNDEPDRHDLRIGPIRGRDAGLAGVVRGFLVNPAQEPETSLVPLLTWADYLRDPAGYDADDAWRRALRAVAGNDADAETVAIVAAGLDRSVIEQRWQRPSAPALSAATSRLGSLKNQALGQELLAVIAGAQVRPAS